MYSLTCIGKHLCDNLPIQIETKFALLPLVFNFTLEYAIRKVLKNQERLTLNQLQTYPYVNLLGDDIHGRYCKEKYRNVN
jgi:hypothetical protein